MFTVLNLVLVLAVLAVCFPIGVFCLEVFLSLFPRRKAAGVLVDHQQTLAVLIPAHNEALVLGHTLGYTPG